MTADSTIRHAAQIFTLFQSEPRLRILTLLSETDRTHDGLAAAPDLAKSSLHRHLAQLYAAGFVSRKRGGQSVRYSLTDRGRQILTFAESIDH